MTLAVTFTVPGRVPSKSNFRWSNTAKAHERWRRITQYQQEVGMSALAAGALRLRRPGAARLRVLLVNQKCDLDNALKAPIDGLKNVIWADDSQEHLASIQVSWTKDSGPARVEYRVEWSESGAEAGECE